MNTRNYGLGLGFPGKAFVGFCKFRHSALHPPASPFLFQVIHVISRGNLFGVKISLWVEYGVSRFGGNHLNAHPIAKDDHVVLERDAVIRQMIVLGQLPHQRSVQCKRYQGSVGTPEIRDFRGAMVGRSDKGLFITTGTFTPAAVKEATRDGAPAIDLIDGDDLADKLKEFSLGVKTVTVEVVSVVDSWFEMISCWLERPVNC
jgi:hypothetical protein